MEKAMLHGVAPGGSGPLANPRPGLAVGPDLATNCGRSPNQAFFFIRDDGSGSPDQPAPEGGDGDPDQGRRTNRVGAGDAIVPGWCDSGRAEQEVRDDRISVAGPGTGLRRADGLARRGGLDPGEADLLVVPL